MTVVDFLVLLVIAGIVGAIGEGLAGYTVGGCLTSIVVGFIGALVGTWLSRSLALPELLNVQVGTVQFPIIWSTIGAALFVALIALLRRPRI